jgi:inner membrane protein
MDNLSHALVGLAAGELIHRVLPAEAAAEQGKTRHRLLLVTAALAGNFPDLDLVLTPLLPAPLGYLLHHRGHTHTLLYAMPQMLMLSAALLLTWPGARRLVRTSSPARLGFVLALLAGFGLHLAMDYLNSYGLHPFHPFDSGWLYGDMVFILEPMFWIALGVPLAMLIGTRRWRLLFMFLLLAVPLYFTLQSYLAWYSLCALYTVALLCVLAHGRGGPRSLNGVLGGAGMLVLFLGGQAVASQEAERMLRTALRLQPDAGTVHDLALTAFPSHPLCWTFAAVESDEARDSYRLTRGVASILPRFLSASSCPEALNPTPGGSNHVPIAVIDQTSGSLKALRETKAVNCFFDAWLRFARVPLLDQGSATDIRFAASLRGNFTTMRLADFEGAACPVRVPSWGYPRMDLIEAGKVGQGASAGSGQ